MTIATSPALRVAANARLLPIDRNDPSLVFYSPLWYPPFGDQPFPALSYDGDDYLSNATANFRSGDSQGAIEAEFRTSYTAATQDLFSSSDESSGAYFLRFSVNATTGELMAVQRKGDTQDTVVFTTKVSDGKWHHAVLSSNGSSYSVILDGVNEVKTSGTNEGDWFADTTLRDNICIGVKKDSTPLVAYFTGSIGYIRIYSRPMLQPEAQVNHSRGRHQAASDTTGLVFNLPTTEGTGNPVDDVGALTMTNNNATWITDNQFYSMDNNRHLMTCQDATWGKYGRIYNGTSSKVIVGGTITGVKSATFWIYPNDNTTRSIMDFDAGTHSIEMDGSGDITATGWTSPTIYVNGVAAAAITQSAWNHVRVTTGTAFNATALVLGQETSYFDGIMGDVLLHNIVPVDTMRNYQATKWRYQS